MYQRRIEYFKRESVSEQMRIKQDKQNFNKCYFPCKTMQVIQKAPLPSLIMISLYDTNSNYLSSHCVVWFGLVSLFNGISTFFRLSNAKAILLEEQ